MITKKMKQTVSLVSCETNALVFGIDEREKVLQIAIKKAELLPAKALQTRTSSPGWLQMLYSA